MGPSLGSAPAFGSEKGTKQRDNLFDTASVLLSEVGVAVYEQSQSGSLSIHEGLVEHRTYHVWHSPALGIRVFWLSFRSHMLV